MNPIEIRDLVVRYRRGWLKPPVTAVDGLSLVVPAGSVVGFLGPNGAGKSSTLKVLMGFQSAASGAVRVFGHPAGSLEARRRIGFLPEVALYYPFLSPREALRLYGRVQGRPEAALRAEVEQLLLEVGLEEHASCRLATFSKGMLQRLGIAQALLGEPDLLILDEVTSGLDPVGRCQLREIMLRRRERGTTIFFSSHELAEVSMMCDRIFLIDQGRVVEERELAELSASLRRYWIRFRMRNAEGGRRNGDGSVFPESETSIPPSAFRIPHSETVEPGSQGATTAWFTSREAHLDGLAWLQRQGAEIVDIGQDEGSLEQYFVTRIGVGQS